MTWPQLGVLVTATGVLVAIAGKIISVYLDRQQARRERVARVVDEYVELCSIGGYRMNPGPVPFIRAGGKSLESHDEIEEAFDDIVDRLGDDHHPLEGRLDEIPEDADLKQDLLEPLHHDGSNLDDVLAAL